MNSFSFSNNCKVYTSVRAVREKLIRSWRENKAINFPEWLRYGWPAGWNRELAVLQLRRKIIFVREQGTGKCSDNLFGQIR